MRHWTQDGAYVAGFLALLVGCGGLVAGFGWAAVSVLALAVALLVGVRALEMHEETRKALDVASTVDALRRQVATLAEESPKTKDTAETALRTARAADAGRANRPPAY